MPQHPILIIKAPIVTPLTDPGKKVVFATAWLATDNVFVALMRKHFPESWLCGRVDSQPTGKVSWVEWALRSVLQVQLRLCAVDHSCKLTALAAGT